MRPDFTKMTVDELRQLYVEKTGVTIEQAEEIKPKSALVEKLMEFYPVSQGQTMSIDKPPLKIFAEAEMEQSENMEFEQEVKAAPGRGDDGWEDYVIEQLRDHEYIMKDGKKYPKSNGLRRVVELLLGPIKFSGPVTVISPNNTNSGNATILYKVDIAFYSDMGQIREFLEVADAGPGNTPEEYAVHASATASSRAAGRAFRNALLLSVNTAEEMNKIISPSTNGPADDIRLLNDNEPIGSHQIAGINNTAKRIKVSVEKVLEHNGFTGAIETLTKSQAHNLIQQLNKYSSGELSIPDSIKETN